MTEIYSYAAKYALPEDIVILMAVVGVISFFGGIAVSAVARGYHTHVIGITIAVFGVLFIFIASFACNEMWGV